ncbi:type I methionyl aminopeptidase [Terrilactibacillus laevilacticus]|uniref:Methionine aminopeptidase n=1 Tax=Terrilactibacillus laevilacticus TaxID=1380157 RepID=A0ABW5PRX9_9BACI|nr:type I methionyl aminopeptidase [Terrilactibacillus laevilacticus]
MIKLKSTSDIEKIRASGRIVALCLKELEKAISPGVKTIELDCIAEKFIKDRDAHPSFKGYDGFLGSICTSVNDELAHGIPGSRILQEGDIISIDVGACYQGFHADSAWTFAVGSISDKNRKLLSVTEKSLYHGLEQAKPGVGLSNISHAIQTYVESNGFSIVRELVGHGVGRDLHEEPDVPNFGRPGRGPRLLPGMVLAVEPMVNAGSRFVNIIEADDWTIVTEDGKNAAHYEHTIVITENGYEILTKP